MERLSVPEPRIAVAAGNGEVITGADGTLCLATAVFVGPWALGRLFIGRAEITATLWERKRRQTT